MCVRPDVLAIEGCERYCCRMSPTIFRQGPFRFFFFSREEPRVHVHVLGPDGEAKFWLEPDISLAFSSGLTKRELTTLEKVVTQRREELLHAWNSYFSG